MSELLVFVRGKNWAAAPQCFGGDLDGATRGGFVEQKEATEAVAKFTGAITKTPQKTFTVWFNDKRQLPTHIVVTTYRPVMQMKKKPAVKKARGRKAF